MRYVASVLTSHRDALVGNEAFCKIASFATLRMSPEMVTDPLMATVFSLQAAQMGADLNPLSVCADLSSAIVLFSNASVARLYGPLFRTAAEGAQSIRGQLGEGDASGYAANIASLADSLVALYAASQTAA
eukprot:Opistho-2@55994